jgi:hypothetical protein
MHHRRQGWILLAASLLLALGCGTVAGGDDAGDGSPVRPDIVVGPDVQDVTTPTDVPADNNPVDARSDVAPDVAPDVPVDAGPIGPTLVYVLSRLTTEMNSPDLPHSGFNLDGLFSTSSDAAGCGHDDSASGPDLDQNMGGSDCRMTGGGIRPGCGGVDNQLPAVAEAIGAFMPGFDLGATLQDSINQHRLVYILRVTGVDDPTNDPSVNFYFYAAYPTFSTGCGSVTADREYQIARSSLTAGGATLDDALIRGAGSIVAGRLRFDAPTGTIFPLTVPAPGATLTFRLQATRMRFDVAATAISNGNLGGWVAGDELRATASALAPGFDTIVEGAVGSLTDVQVAGTCFVPRAGATPPRYGGVSMGLGLAGLRARIHPTVPIVASQSPGTCGF